MLMRLNRIIRNVSGGDYINIYVPKCDRSYSNSANITIGVVKK